MNPITGKCSVEICGETYSIRFDWDALAAVKAAHGDSPNLLDTDVLADVAAIGMEKFHPEMTAERIKDLAPPVVPFAGKIQTALQYAYFGGEALPDDAEKKSRLKTGSLRRINQRFKLAWIRLVSGQ